MKSCHGLIKYTIEAFTIDDDHKGHESRGEKEILLLVPNLDLVGVVWHNSTIHFFCLNFLDIAAS